MEPFVGGVGAGDEIDHEVGGVNGVVPQRAKVKGDLGTKCPEAVFEAGLELDGAAVLDGVSQELVTVHFYAGDHQGRPTEDDDAAGDGTDGGDFLDLFAIGLH